ncbi:MAG: helix-turn-helix domain-containing protein [ANME-2 cluster archaeon]|nr:MAG: helix-turn-helix domain-containing protein [ANME-2 cluster archaeon]
MSKVKNYITTGEAAAIFDVEPDTVLRWIKSGDIPAIRTPGGHYRINRNVFLTKMIKDTSTKDENETRSTLSYCWEFNSESGIIRDECKECIVYKSKASKCYELCSLPVAIGHAKLFCSESCNDCQYFKSILQSAN